ncbi:helix-turn-helix domain-containing protein [Cohnella boryungensis]|uniref:Helix-turn-helix domain-containing protein n=1 Tax=Cohnella boryungensis TaxID=768479 RepID=A0ABV8SC02_9BACL
MSTGMRLPFRSCLFSLTEIKLESLLPSARMDKQMAEAYTLLGIEQGTGILMLDGKRYRLGKAAGFLIHPSSVYELEADEGGELECYLAIFRVQRVVGVEGNDGHPVELSPAFPLAGKLNIQPLGQWLKQLRALYANRVQEQELDAFKQHIRLQELLYYLFSRNAQASSDQPYAAISRTLDALHADITQPITVEQLARMANLGVRQYTYLFKELTGLTPSEYVAKLRIDQAKKQLLFTSDSLNAIARQVGFHDVYYFSRRFKQLVGQSPKHYVDERRRELRVVALYYGGILMSMGVKPVGANLTWWGGSAYLRKIEATVMDVGAAPSLDEIAMLKPDLILMNDNNRADYDNLKKIAPSILIPYDGKRSVYEEARIIGDLIGHARSAERLSAQFDRKAAESRKRIAAAGIASEKDTAAIIRIEENGTAFSIFGDNYGRGGWAVYRGFRFQAPNKVRQLMASGRQVEQKIPLRLLADYTAEADLLFVVNEGEGVDRVSDQEDWMRIPAVKRNRLFELRHEEISYVDPLSCEAQLELLTELLVSGSASWEHPIF